jgi:hypothetical protein
MEGVFFSFFQRNHRDCFFFRSWLSLSLSPLDLFLPPPSDSHAETDKTQQQQLPRVVSAVQPRHRPSVATRSSSSASFGNDASGAASSDSDTDDLENDASFKRARWATFIAMFVGYGAFYLTRNSLAFTAPAMLEDKSLGLTLKVKKKKVFFSFFFFLFLTSSLSLSLSLPKKPNFSTFSSPWAPSPRSFPSCTASPSSHPAF